MAITQKGTEMPGVPAHMTLILNTLKTGFITLKPQNVQIWSSLIQIESYLSKSIWASSTHPFLLFSRDLTP
jgi:hypothetical protein